MELPDDLGDWTFDTVCEVVNYYDLEPGEVEYKAVLNVTDRNDQARYIADLRTAVCGMANSNGGHILFGVQDRRMPAATPTDRIVGIPVGGDLRKEFADKISTIERHVHFDASSSPIELPSNRRLGIFVVHIPLSARRPHMLAGVFYHRTDGGSPEAMTFVEVRDQILYTEDRWNRLAILRSEMAHMREALRGLRHTDSDTHLTFRHVDVTLFKILLADTRILIGSQMFDILSRMAWQIAHQNDMTHAMRSHVLTDEVRQDFKAICETGEQVLRDTEAMLDADFGPSV